MHVAIVLHPRAIQGERAGLWERALGELRAQATVTPVETRGDAGDVERLASLLREARPDVLAAAGGDGTVNCAAAAILRAGDNTPTALAVLPFGTGNDFARSFGLASFRTERDRGVDLAVAAILRGPRRAIDLGSVNEHPFVGSFSIGMDADILTLRNRLRGRFGLSGEVGGYALYLWSCAACVLSGSHGGEADLALDGVAQRRRVYNVTVLNTAIYAGEFRFDGENDSADGQLDVHAVAGAAEYLAEYPRAWRRHVHFQRRDTVAPSRFLRRAREVRIDMARPVASQVDGEEFTRSALYRIKVLPRALSLCLVPSPTAAG